MKNIVCFPLLSFLALLAVGSSVAQTARLIPDNIYGTRPPDYVTQWTRISVLGLRNRPYRIVWLSPHPFKRSGFEKYIALTPSEYRGVQALTRAYSCLDPPDHAAEMIRPRLLMVTEGSAATSYMRCRVPTEATCEYLTKLVRIPGIRGFAKNESYILDIAEDVDCSISEGPSRN